MKQNELLDGITLSGGEPFEQVDELLPLLKLITPEYNVWSYSGYIYEDLIQDTNKKKLLQYIDYLIDGPYIEDLRDLTLQFRGSSNQRIINVQESLKQQKIIQK
jgi:anaerobic ribonucleoside-triphosphate reductase activating protein